MTLKRDPENLNGQTNTLKAELNRRSKLSEQTLFIVKPDGVQRKLIGEIISRFEKRFYNFKTKDVFRFSKELASEFYSVHKDKPFFGELLEYMTSGPVVVTVVEGNNAVYYNKTDGWLQQNHLKLNLVQFVVVLV